MIVDRVTASPECLSVSKASNTQSFAGTRLKSPGVKRRPNRFSAQSRQRRLGPGMCQHQRSSCTTKTCGFSAMQSPQNL